MDLSTHPLLLSFGLLLGPALLAGLACLWGARRGRLGVVGALGLALGYLGGHAATLGGLPPLPPATSNEALFWTAALGGLCALLALRVRGALAMALLAGCGGAGAAGLLLRARLGDMALAELALELGGSALAAAAGVLALERLAERERGAENAALSAVLASATAACVGLTGSVTYAQFGASLAAVLVAALVAGWLARGADFSRALGLLAVVQVLALALAGSQFSSLPTAARWALACAPACLLAAPLASARWRWIALAVPLVVALVLAWQQHAARASSVYG
ncbi:MAG: hypothetical protein ACKO4Q_19200 [Planctomycetota bacterium]